VLVCGTDLPRHIQSDTYIHMFKDLVDMLCSSF
jgi:hypothetical protein